MSAPSIPQHYWLFPQVSGTMGLDTNLEGTVTANTNLNGQLNTNVNATVGSEPDRPLATLLIGDNKRPISTDSKVEILNLPRFTLQDIKDMMKIRTRIPNYSQVCFKLFGQELFSICVNGEAQVITEPYIPNALERCEIECCEPDTRPFPDNANNPDLKVESDQAK